MTNTERELDAFASWEREAWESRAAPYADDIASLTRGAADALLDAAAVSTGRRVLDVATGPGVVALAAQGRGADVVAVDQAEAMVGIARDAGLDARTAGADQLPFGDGTFDAVVAGFLVNHLARPERGVAEMARVCRGRVAVSVWDLPGANPVLGLFGPVVQDLGLPNVVPPGPDSHLYSDEGRLRALLAAVGLEDIRIVRVRWAVTVVPGAWFDAVAASTPRTGAVLSAASVDERGALRERYLEVARATYGATSGLVTLPAAAVVGSGQVGS